jgi:hypothetical protein
VIGAYCRFLDKVEVENSPELPCSMVISTLLQKKSTCMRTLPLVHFTRKLSFLNILKLKFQLQAHFPYSNVFFGLFSLISHSRNSVI